MKRVSCTIFGSSKVPEGQDAWITSVVEKGDSYAFWLLWEGSQGGWSRCKETLETCTVYDRRITHKTTIHDLYGLWCVDH